MEQISKCDSDKLIIINSNEQSSNSFSYSKKNSSIQNVNFINIHKTSSSYVSCPFCSHESLTVVKKSINWFTIFFCLFSLIIIWILLQKVRGKTLSIWNIEHYCMKCDNKISENNSC